MIGQIFATELDCPHEGRFKLSRQALQQEKLMLQIKVNMQLPNSCSTIRLDQHVVCTRPNPNSAQRVLQREGGFLGKARSAI
jgi:hypothetical protein